jgi:hypothetical protein
VAQREGRGIALLFHDLGTRRAWVGGQCHAPAVLYPRKRPGTHYTGGWVGPRAGLDRCGKSRPTGIRSPDRPARSQLLYRLSYPAHKDLSAPQYSDHNKCTKSILTLTLSLITHSVSCILARVTYSSRRQLCMHAEWEFQQAYAYS